MMAAFFTQAIIHYSVASKMIFGINLCEILTGKSCKEPIIIFRFTKALHKITCAAVKPIVFTIMGGYHSSQIRQNVVALLYCHCQCTLFCICFGSGFEL